MDLTLKIIYDFKKDSFSINSEIDKEKIINIVNEWLKDRIGEGADEKNATKKDVYCINIGLDIEKNKASLSSDTGNKSLTIGILLDLLSVLMKKPNLNLKDCLKI